MQVVLPSSVSSLQDLNTLSLEIREYAKWFAHNAIKQRVHAKNATPPPILSSAGLEMIRSVSSSKLLSQKDLDTLLAEFEVLKLKAPTITITLAAPASKDVKESLVSACRLHIAHAAFVNFKFNSSILGGMVISYGSHVLDWSFRRQILENRLAFTEVLKSV